MAYLGSMSTTTYTLGNQRVFFGPWLDFLFMGGGSLIALPLLAALIPDTALPQVGFAVLVLAVIINHPHFAHSYQIFYANYRPIMQAPRIDAKFRLLYLWSGVGVPALLFGYFALTLFLGEPAMLRYAVNAMMFFVGWHYVKQGFGMLMVDAAMRQSWFGKPARAILLVNSYVCWGASWLVVNRVVAERDFLGLSYYTIPVTDQVLAASLAVLALTSAAALLVLIQHLRRHGAAFPLTGTAAYVAALYVWLFMNYNPVLGALIPAFHALQYLYMVWRYRLNVETAEPDAALPVEVLGGELPVQRRHSRLVSYVLSGTLLGIVGFWVLPIFLDHVVAYDQALFGSNLFLVMTWVFINVHHFFIDTAMWREENPHTLSQLLAHR